jgi:hypothetical protein
MNSPARAASSGVHRHLPKATRPAGISRMKSPGGIVVRKSTLAEIIRITNPTAAVTRLKAVSLAAGDSGVPSVDLGRPVSSCCSLIRFFPV